MKPVPVLMYHHVNPHKGDMVTVTPGTFEAQMKFLHDSGFRTLGTYELAAYIDGKLTLNGKSVIVTFDDGWLDNYVYAYPILKRYGINATVFLVTDWVDRASEDGGHLAASVPLHKESKRLIREGMEHLVVLNWDMIKEMSGGGLVEFHSHTKSHRECDSLTKYELVQEVRDSRSVIEKRLGTDCRWLCWPYGKYNDLAKRIARDAGYRALFTTKHGVFKQGSDPFEIRRMVIKDSVAWFKKRMVIYTSSILSPLLLRMKKGR